MSTFSEMRSDTTRLRVRLAMMTNELATVSLEVQRLTVCAPRSGDKQFGTALDKLATLKLALDQLSLDLAIAEPICPQPG